MNITYKTGDLFADLPAGRNTIIAHVNNDGGAWGAGFVLAVSHHYPLAEQAYFEWAAVHPVTDPLAGMPAAGDPAICNYPVTDRFCLGAVQLVRVAENVYVANMVAQGGRTRGSRAVRYNHLCRCMDSLIAPARKLKASIVCPLFGAGIGGGDWKVIEQLIVDSWVSYAIPVTVYQLPPRPPASVPAGAVVQVSPVVPAVLQTDTSYPIGGTVQTDAACPIATPRPASETRGKPPVPAKPPAPKLREW